MGWTYYPARPKSRNRRRNGYLFPERVRNRGREGKIFQRNRIAEQRSSIAYRLLWETQPWRDSDMNQWLADPTPEACGFDGKFQPVLVRLHRKHTDMGLSQTKTRQTHPRGAAMGAALGQRSASPSVLP
jgi:hypothetical protein